MNITDSTAPGAEIASQIDYGRTRSGQTQLRRQWRAAGDARAVVVLVHGISEHSGRYEHVGEYLAQAGLHVVAYDQRGHGGTDGRRTFVESFDHFLDDVEDHLSVARRSGLPVILIGHSMGGLVSLSYATSDRPQPDLLVLSGPAMGAEVPKWQRALAPHVAQLAPTFFLPSPDFDPAILSRDEAVQAAYMADPHIRPGATAGLGAILFKRMDEVTGELDRLRVPALCLHGADDELVPAASTVPLTGLANVERHELAGLRHEIFNEPEWPEVLDQVLEWVNARL